MSKIAIFASGRGSNAAQIIDFFQEEKSELSVNVIYTNKSDAGIHEVAKQYGITIRVFTNKEFESADRIADQLKKDQVDWIVLAGFLRKIEGSILTEYENRIINIHPSLLPKYGGKGMYGNKVHESVINAGEKESGISIHLVNQEFDKGEILFQATCKIEKGQTVEGLRKKIQNLEHEYFPSVIMKSILEKRNTK